MEESSHAKVSCGAGKQRAGCGKIDNIYNINVNSHSDPVRLIKQFKTFNGSNNHTGGLRNGPRAKEYNKYFMLSFKGFRLRLSAPKIPP